MAKLPVIKGADATFGRAGFKLDHWEGGHAILRHTDGRHLSIPASRKDLKTGTLRTLIRKAGLSVDSFTRLLK